MKRMRTRFPILTLVLPSLVSSFASRSNTVAKTFRSTLRLHMTSSVSSTKLPPVSGRIRQTLDPCVVLMKELIGQYADLWKDKGGIYSLAQGVVYWTPPASTKAALIAALEDESADLHMYGPDEGLWKLRSRLLDKVQSENELSNHDVMVTVGANQAYVNCVLTLLSGGDKAVVFAPYYFNHVMALQMTLPDDGLVVGPCSNDGIPNLEWLAKRLEADKTIKMVTIANPGNPTGTTLSRDALQKVVDLCREHACWLVLDCTYEYFVPESRFDGCFADAHVVHIFSLSKAYALAGYRCGYVVVAKEAAIYDEMMKVQDTIPIAPSRIAQVAALGALEAGREWVQERVETLATGREAILKALEPLEQVMGGSGAMYVMGKLPVEDDQEVATRLVREYGVAVIPGSFCGFPGWIRVCYANLPPAKCQEAAERLAQGLRDVVAECA